MSKATKILVGIAIGAAVGVVVGVVAAFLLNNGFHAAGRTLVIVVPGALGGFWAATRRARQARDSSNP